MTREEQYKCFLEGWKAYEQTARTVIEEYTSNWLPNGPSLAAAKAILIKLSSIPQPRSEDELNEAGPAIKGTVQDA